MPLRPVSTRAFYRRHLDRFRDDDRRAVSAVFYLNENWQPGDGGELRMFLADEVVRDVQPTAGTLVVFLSGDIPTKYWQPGEIDCP